MKKKILIWITLILTLAGIGISIYAYYIDRASLGNLVGAISLMVGVIGTLVTINSSKEQPAVQLDLAMATKLADEELKKRHELDQTELALRDKMIAELKEQLAGKDLPDYEQAVKQYVEEGDYAKAIESIDTDAADSRAAERHLFKAKLLIADNRFAEAETHYRRVVEILPSYDNNFAMAGFYYDLNRFNEAEAYYNICLTKAKSEEERAKVLNRLGNNQSNNCDYVNAEKSYTEALEIRRELAEKNPQAYNPDVAMTLNNLGLLQANILKHEEAKESYKEALEIYTDLAENNPQAYSPDVAMTLNNLGILQANIQKHEEAEKSFTEALEINRDLAKNNPQAYNPDLASTLNNLGVFQANIQKHAEAEKSYKEALEIYRELAEKNPQAYNPDVAMTLNNLGNLQKDNQNYEEAEKSYTEALEIKRDLAEKNPQAYNPDVATTLINLSFLYLCGAPDKKLSLKYANEAEDVLKKCNDTPFVRDLFDKVSLIRTEWEEKKQ
jgi:tetratricopeptide (TPR) repeat protein